jgi:hypothetical protein
VVSTLHVQGGPPVGASSTVSSLETKSSPPASSRSMNGHSHSHHQDREVKSPRSGALELGPNGINEANSQPNSNYEMVVGKPEYGSYSWPRSVALAYHPRDGRQMLVVANTGAHSIGLLVQGSVPPTLPYSACLSSINQFINGCSNRWIGGPSGPTPNCDYGDCKKPSSVRCTHCLVC